MIIIREKRLREKFEACSKEQLELLQDQIDQNPETNRMLTTPMREIPQYRWIFGEELQQSGLRDSTLAQAIAYFSAGYPRVKLFFSKAGTLFTGFLVYAEQGTIIDNIKMASFKEASKPNPVLVSDLLVFIKKEATQKSKIEWLADKENLHAVSQYDRFLAKNKILFTRTESKSRKLWVYTVTGIRR